MLIKELLKLTETYKDFSDPDHAPGAIEREADARISADKISLVAVDNLNELIHDYSLGTTLTYGEYPGRAGKWVKTDPDGHKTPEGQAVGFLLNEDYVVYFSNVENAKEEAKMMEMRIKTEARGHYGLYAYADNDKVYIKFGPAYRYYDLSLVKVFRNIMDYALQHIK